MADQEDQEQNQHVAIEMDEFDDLPFAEMAALPLRDIEARERRIASVITAKVLDGHQVQQLSVRAARLHRHRCRARIEGN
ncbi:hypothetical protein TNCT_17231 [Trichonephila clavata]|uniref:Uncharacterized protein n=1 Tax=Trichonephila clavata TaxID=2740835 RepID=A0A8X6H6M1_TRICU|nr:hypothetical protein TNCT_17231 [Trichonephila clavata]